MSYCILYWLEFETPCTVKLYKLNTCFIYSFKILNNSKHPLKIHFFINWLLILFSYLPHKIQAIWIPTESFQLNSCYNYCKTFKIPVGCFMYSDIIFIHNKINLKPSLAIARICRIWNFGNPMLWIFWFHDWNS